MLIGTSSIQACQWIVACVPLTLSQNNDTPELKPAPCFLSAIIGQID